MLNLLVCNINSACFQGVAKHCSFIMSVNKDTEAKVCEREQQTSYVAKCSASKTFKRYLTI